MTGKIIQIACSTSIAGFSYQNEGEETMETRENNALYALCDDGTIWYWRTSQWVQLVERK